MPANRPQWTTRDFWLDAADRAVRTGAQTALALGITDATTSLHLDWQQGGIAVGLAMLGSVLTALAARTVDGTLSPASLVKADPQPQYNAGGIVSSPQLRTTDRPEEVRRPDHLGGVPPLPDRDTRDWQ